MEHISVKSIKTLIRFFQGFGSNDLIKLSSDVWTVKEINQWQMPQKEEMQYGLLELIYRSPMYLVEINMGICDLTKFLSDVHGTNYYGSLNAIDMNALKKVAKPTSSKTIYEVNLDPTYSLNAILEKIGWRFGIKLACPMELKPSFEQFLIIESGGRYTPPPLPETNSFGRLIICLPSKFTGGEFVFSHGENYEKISFAEVSEQNCSWIIVFGNSIKDPLPVTSGTQILVTYTVALGKSTPIEHKKKKVYPGIIIGPQAPDYQKHLIKHLSHKMEEEALGIILSTKEYIGKEPSVEMLKGTDKLFWNTITELGGCCSVQTVLFEEFIAAPNTSLKPHEISSVYSFNQDDLQYVLNGTKPIQKEDRIPFYQIGISKKVTPDFSQLEYSENDGSDNSDDSDNDGRVRERVRHNMYLLPAMLIEFPTWWTRARLLWIAKKKNNPTECLLAVLPSDIIREIAEMLRKEAVANLKKRKREEEEEEEDGNSDSDSN